MLLARRVGWVAPVRPTLGQWFVAPCPSAALGVYTCAASGAPWRSFTGLRVPCILCAVSVASWHLLTGVRVVCGTHVVLVASLGSPPPFCGWLFDAFLFLFLLLLFDVFF